MDNEALYGPKRLQGPESEISECAHLFLRTSMDHSTLRLFERFGAPGLFSFVIVLFLDICFRTLKLTTPTYGGPPKRPRACESFSVSCSGSCSSARGNLHVFAWTGIYSRFSRSVAHPDRCVDLCCYGDPRDTQPGIRNAQLRRSQPFGQCRPLGRDLLPPVPGPAERGFA